MFFVAQIYTKVFRKTGFTEKIVSLPHLNKRQMAEPRRNTRVAKTAKTKPMDEYGHLQPQAPELEEAVLGALMIERMRIRW